MTYTFITEAMSSDEQNDFDASLITVPGEKPKLVSRGTADLMAMMGGGPR